MKRIGLTGGIGMGKSTFAQVLAKRGVPIIDADEIARRLSQAGQAAYREILARFGAVILKQSAEIDRAKLGAIIFGDREARRDLERILHPRIREEWLAQLNDWDQAGRPVGCAVIPLLFETNAATHFDAVICVASTPQSQQFRLRRRGWTLDQIAQRNAAQWPIPQKMLASNFVVWNEGDVSLLARQWTRIAPELGL